MNKQSAFRLSVIVVATLLCSACVTHIRPTVDGNPPPDEPFAHYQHFKLQPTKVSSSAADEEDAVAKINEYIDERVRTQLETWDSDSQGGRTLIVTPEITKLKFVSGAGRFFAGAMAGSSAVLMHVAFVDSDTGKRIAYPEFYQRAAAMGGAYTFGATDNGMLARIVTVIKQYLNRNYKHAVGGPTGLEEDAGS